MLSRILAIVGAAGRPLCVADLQRELDVDAFALEGMLDTLVARGRLRVERDDDPGCGACPIRSGCFLMANGVSATYALLDEGPLEVAATAPALQSARVA